MLLSWFTCNTIPVEPSDPILDMMQEWTDVSYTTNRIQSQFANLHRITSSTLHGQLNSVSMFTQGDTSKWITVTIALVTSLSESKDERNGKYYH